MGPHHLLRGVTARGSFLVAMLLLGWPGPVTFAEEVAFPGFRTFVTPGEGGHVTSDDFDRDGYADVAMASWRVALMFGDATGRPGRGVILDPEGAVTRLPRRIVAADLDLDGHLDLIVVDSGMFDPEGPNHGVGGKVDLYFGDGDGGLSERISLTVGFSPQWAQLGDFNGDGLLDLAVWIGEQSPVGIVLATAPRAFARAGQYSIFTGIFFDVGDVNGDGHLDLVGEAGDGIATLLGDGTGSFTPGPRSVRTFPGVHIRLADFNEDGVLDVIQGGAVVRFGTGSGTFSGRSQAPFFPREIRDVNGDGHLDLVGEVRFGQTMPRIRVAFGDGAGEFPTAHQYIIGGNVRDASVGDVNADGSQDLIVTMGNRVMVSLGRPTGTFAFPPVFGVFGFGRPSGAAVADFNEDGHVDFALVQDTGLLLVLGNGQGGFEYGNTGSVPRYGRLIAADADGDGHADLVVAHDRNAITIVPGDGRGGLGSPLDVSLPLRPTDVAVADYNEDGVPDLVVASRGEHIPNARLDFFIGDGSGGFLPGASYPLTRGYLQSLSVCDLNGDGHLDVVVGSSGDGAERPSSAFFLGDGNASFVQSTIASALGWSVSWVAAGDLDEDGAVDVAAALGSQSAVRLLFGDGLGGIREMRTLPTQVRAEKLTLADIDEDGHLDLVAAGWSIGDIAIFLGDGRGDFGPRYGFGVSSVNPEPLVADFDGDGHLDILATNTVLFNRTFRQPEFSARAGNVNAAAGPVTDVLFVNGSPGLGGSRTVHVARDEPLQVRMEAPPSMGGGPAPFALYLRLGKPSERTVRTLPFRIGMTCISTPLNGGRPFRAANNIGYPNRLGVEDWPQSTVPAPSTVLDRSAGVGRPGLATLQGIILDRAAPNGRAAVTNAVIVDVR